MYIEAGCFALCEDGRGDSEQVRLIYAPRSIVFLASSPIHRAWHDSHFLGTLVLVLVLFLDFSSSKFLSC
jgi:hypothetical protein